MTYDIMHEEKHQSNNIKSNTLIALLNLFKKTTFFSPLYYSGTLLSRTWKSLKPW